MNKIPTTILLALLLLLAHTSFAQKQRKANPHEAGEDIYKHYTGTIGKKKVVVDLRYGYQGGSNYGGSTYYTPGKEGTTRFIIGEPESFDHGVPLTADETRDDSLGASWAFHNVPCARWTFTIKKDSLKGTWHNADGTEQYPINLVESYSKSCPMDIYFAKTGSGNNSKTIIMAQPAASANRQWSDFVNGALEMATEEDDAAGQHQAEGYLMPVYNDNGMLVLRKDNGAQGVSIMSYLCFDLTNKKMWTKSEILKGDNTKLSALLETALRAKYKLDPEKKLSTWFKVEKLSAPKTVMIGNKGLCFTYSPGEIYSPREYNSEITIFLSYKQLNDLLTPAFKKRMDL